MCTNGWRFRLQTSKSNPRLLNAKRGMFCNGQVNYAIESKAACISLAEGKYWRLKKNKQELKTAAVDKKASVRLRVSSRRHTLADYKGFESKNSKWQFNLDLRETVQLFLVNVSVAFGWKYPHKRTNLPFVFTIQNILILFTSIPQINIFPQFFHRVCEMVPLQPGKLNVSIATLSKLSDV